MQLEADQINFLTKQHILIAFCQDLPIPQIGNNKTFLSWFVTRLVSLLWLFPGAGVATACELAGKIWQFFYVGCPSYCNLACLF